MARRRKRSYSKPTNRRRGRMGAIGGKADIMNLLAGIGGAVAANYLSSKVIPQALEGMGLDDKTKTLVADAAPLALAFVLPAKGGTLSAVMQGMKIGSGMRLVSGLAGISGISPLAYYSVPAVTGMEDVRSLPVRSAAGIPDVSELTAYQVAAAV